MLFLDGLYVSERGRLRFRRVKAPDKAELESLVHTLSKRVGRYLERQGLPARHRESSAQRVPHLPGSGLTSV